MEQRSEEWFAAKLGKVGCSRLYDIMPGKKGAYLASRKNYMAELICERLTGQWEEGFISGPMQWGIDTEPLARSDYEAMNDVMINQVGFIDHPTIEGFGGSPDGLINQDGAIEIKCPNTATHIETLRTGKIDQRYIYQIHGNMMCSDRSWWDFYSFDPRLPGNLCRYQKRFYRDAQIENEIKKEMALFLEELADNVEALGKMQ